MNLLIKVFAIISTPWGWLLSRLIRLTGRRSTFFVRAAMSAAAGVGVVEVVLALLHREDGWPFKAALVPVVVLITGRQVLEEARNSDWHLEVGSGAIQMHVDAFFAVMFAAVLWTVLGTVVLAAFPVAGFLPPLRYLLFGCAFSWLLMPNGGGKSAWARLKERLRAPRPAFEGAR